jgi:hypothetical protein
MHHKLIAISEKEHSYTRTFFLRAFASPSGLSGYAAALDLWLNGYGTPCVLSLYMPWTKGAASWRAPSILSPSVRTHMAIRRARQAFWRSLSLISSTFTPAKRHLAAHATAAQRLNGVYPGPGPEPDRMRLNF